MGLLTLFVCVFGLVVVISGQENDDFIRIRKCCPEGQARENNQCIKKNLTFSPPFTRPQPKGFKVIIGVNCNGNSMYVLEPEKSRMDEFHLLPSGNLYVPSEDKQELSPDEYCLESFVLSNGSAIVLPMLCAPSPEPDQYLNEFGIELFKIGCLISILFLIITMATYLLITELRTINGKILICYLSCLAIAYASLSYFQFEGDKLVENTCKNIAFLIQFSYAASFFWLNVSCFHTWRAITRSDVLSRRSSSGRSAFFWYSVYGWGCPFVILAISLIMDQLPMVPISYKINPNVHLGSCGFIVDTAKRSYELISIFLVAKVVFFLFKIWYIHMKYKKESLIKMRNVATQMMFNMRKQILIKSVLFFCVMGLNWVLEIISWLVTNSLNQDTMPQLWIFISTFNTLHGIIIFLVFVIGDSKVRKLALTKFYFKSGYLLKDIDDLDSKLV